MSAVSEIVGQAYARTHEHNGEEPSLLQPECLSTPVFSGEPLLCRLVWNDTFRRKVRMARLNKHEFVEKPVAGVCVKEMERKVCCMIWCRESAHTNRLACGLQH